jgi:hypothetical protein
MKIMNYAHSSLTGAPWWRHLSKVPANSRCRRVIASEPGLKEG